MDNNTMTADEMMLAAQRGKAMRGTHVGTMARAAMQSHKDNSIRTREAALHKNIVTPSTTIPFMVDEYHKNFRVSDLDTLLTPKGKQLVISILMDGRIPTRDEYVMIGLDQEEYIKTHQTEIRMMKQKMDNARFITSSIIYYMSERLEDIVIETLALLDKCRPISHHHKSIPIRKRIREFMNKTYRHARDRELSKVSDVDAVFDNIDNYNENYITPSWQKVQDILVPSLEYWHNNNTTLTSMLNKMGMSKEAYIQFELMMEFAGLLQNTFKQCDEHIHEVGFSRGLHIDMGKNTMVQVVDMVNSLKNVLFDGQSYYCARIAVNNDEESKAGKELTEYVDKHEYDIEETERAMLRNVLSYDNVYNTENPDLLQHMKDNRNYYKQMRSNHPDWNDVTLYKEFCRVHGEHTIEKHLASQFGQGYRNSLKKIQTDDKPLSKKSYAELWKRLCAELDVVVKKYIEDDELVMKRCNEYLDKEHPEFTEEERYDFITEKAKIGVPMHPVASYDVAQLMLRLEMPLDFQEYLRETAQKRELANAKRRAKRALKSSQA